VSPATPYTLIQRSVVLSRVQKHGLRAVTGGGAVWQAVSSPSAPKSNLVVFVRLVEGFAESLQSTLAYRCCCFWGIPALQRSCHCRLDDSSRTLLAG